MIKIFHNPQCSKSCLALEAIRAAGVKHEVVHYLETPPSLNELDLLSTLLGIEPREMIRTKGEDFKVLALKNTDSWNHREWLELLVKHPNLLQRPIIVKGNQAVVARPLEKLHDLL